MPCSGGVRWRLNSSERPGRKVVGPDGHAVIYNSLSSNSFARSVAVAAFQTGAEVMAQERWALGPLQGRTRARQSTRSGASRRPHERCGRRSRHARTAPASRSDALRSSLPTAERVIGTGIFAAWTRFLSKKSIFSHERRALASSCLLCGTIFCPVVHSFALPLNTTISRNASLRSANILHEVIILGEVNSILDYPGWNGC